eukprot:m.477849 g.477849  ORF g.477849 m.477849 type:complete len:51 (+) comp20962_c0_seq1:2238-2390(+)
MMILEVFFFFFESMCQAFFVCACVVGWVFFFDDTRDKDVLPRDVCLKQRY